MSTIFINGEARELERPSILSELLKEFGFDGKYLAVAVNDAVVPRSSHGDTTIKEGDKLEIIHAVGGG